MSSLGVFKNNEHVIVTTIIDLTKAFFGGGGVGGSGGDRGPTGGATILHDGVLKAHQLRGVRV